jgi:Tfp pilus assembly protein PilV
MRTHLQRQYRQRGARRQRGVSLVEAMIAFLVMGIGMLSIIGVQMTMRFNSDVSKQRSEAVRLAQEEMEKLRAFSSIAGAGENYTNIVDAGPADLTGYTTNTTYRVTRQINTIAEPGYKTASVLVQWNDRYNGTQAVSLNSAVTRLDPMLSGVLSIALGNSPVRNPVSRMPGIPPTAHDLGDGRSAYKPSPTGTVAFVFNNTTGVITNVCNVAAAATNATLTAGSLSGCVSTVGYLLSGAVRFSDDVPVTALIAEDPVGVALDLDMQLTLTGGAYPPPGFRCFDDAPAVAVPTITTVNYACVVFPDSTSLQWSGQLTVVPVGGWVYGSTAAEFRLCRYSADYNGDGVISYDEHPEDYEDVPGNLSRQNFLVVHGDAACPTDVAANPSVGDFINTNTVQVEPGA